MSFSIRDQVDVLFCYLTGPICVFTTGPLQISVEHFSDKKIDFLCMRSMIVFAVEYSHVDYCVSMFCRHVHFGICEPAGLYHTMGRKNWTSLDNTFAI